MPDTCRAQPSCHPTLVVCIGCGCTDRAACPGGCEWLRMDMKTLRGVCSRCPGLVEQWDADFEARRFPK
jgi:hypothetical protein